MGNRFTQKEVRRSRFLVFAFKDVTRYGGWGDLDGYFDTLEDALEDIRDRHSHYDIWEVVDLEIGEVVWRGLSEFEGRKRIRYLRQYFPKEVLEAL
jgi:hypothetical protein